MRMNSVRRLETALQAGEQKIPKRALLQSGIVNFHSDNICGRDLIILESRHHIIPEIPILDRLIRQDFPRILIICIRRHGLTAEKNL